MRQEQTNTSNSLKDIIIDTSKMFIDLLIPYYKNKPVKFWTNVVLLVLSILTIIIVQTNKCLIPFIFNDRLTYIINVYVYFSSVLYVVGLFLCLIFKALNLNQNLKWAILIMAAIFLPMFIALNIIPIYRLLQLQILPGETIPISEFGGFLGAIVSLFAFYGVLINLMQSEKRADKAETISRDRYREDSDRTIFFQLLELHTKKVESVIYSNANNIKELVGARAFERFVDKANTYWVLTIVFEHILTLKEDDSIYYKDAYMKVKDIFEQYNLKTVQSLIRDNNNRFKIKGYENIIRDPEYMEDYGRFEIWSWAESIEIELLRNEDYSYITKLITMVADVIYKEYGHILGHYFRNMFYVMDTINEFSDKKNYKELFRAQLSRYELILGLFNAVSSNSSLKMVELLEEFDIFKDVYAEDLQLLKTAKEKGIEPSILIKNILNEYLKSATNFYTF